MKINSLKINSILFKSLIRSLSDYAFIPLSSPTQRIMKKLQTMQIRILRQIKHFPLKSKTSNILGHFKLESLDNRTKNLLTKFADSKSNHDLIASELKSFKENVHRTERKLQTVFDKILQADHHI
jgi:hypothetical protein